MSADYVVDPETGCWDWLRAVNGEGYPYKSSNGRSVRAHRLYYERFVGPILDDLTIDHLCLNKVCVNPAHMEPVTRAENARRGQGMFNGRCKRGHLFEGDNIYVSPAGKRQCRACRNGRADRMASKLGDVAKSVELLSTHVLRIQAALLVLAADESLPSVTRASIAAALAGEASV